MFLSLWFVTTIQDLSWAILNKFLWDFGQPTFKSQQWCLRNFLRFNDCNSFSDILCMQTAIWWNILVNGIRLRTVFCTHFYFIFSRISKGFCIINFTDECWSNIHKNRIQFRHFQSEKKTILTTDVNRWRHSITSETFIKNWFIFEIILNEYCIAHNNWFKNDMWRSL